MGGRYNELNRPGGKGRVACAQQFFGSLAFSLAPNDLLAAIRETIAGSARTGLIVVDHKESCGQSSPRIGAETEREAGALSYHLDHRTTIVGALLRCPPMMRTS